MTQRLVASHQPVAPHQPIAPHQPVMPHRPIGPHQPIAVRHPAATHSVTWVAFSLLVAALCLLLGACSPVAPEPGPRHAVAPTAPIDPAQPCVRATAPAPDPGGQPAPVGLEAGFDRVANTIVLSAGKGVTLPALSQTIDDPAALRELAPGEWLLGANLEVLAGASLRIAAPGVRWLKMSSGTGGFVSVTALGGGLDISGACITSWWTS